jgi:hypothetical protein
LQQREKRRLMHLIIAGYVRRYSVKNFILC